MEKYEFNYLIETIGELNCLKDRLALHLDAENEAKALKVENEELRLFKETCELLFKGEVRIGDNNGWISVHNYNDEETAAIIENARKLGLIKE